MTNHLMERNGARLPRSLACYRDAWGQAYSVLLDGERRIVGTDVNAEILGAPFRIQHFYSGSRITTTWPDYENRLEMLLGSKLTAAILAKFCAIPHSRGR